MNPTCSHCGDPVDPASPTIWRKVTGWERKALSSSRRSGSDIVLREPVEDKFACSTCITKLKSNIAPAQGALV